MMVIGIAVDAAQAGGPPTNACSDPYWRNTLRCEAIAFLATPPLPPPQPIPAPPANVGDIRAFTRVEIPDLSVRCVDGTRPIVYIDPSPVPSNRWILTMTGGEYCSARDLDGNGSFESGQACLDDYITQGGALMGTATMPSMNNVMDEFGDDGVQSGDVRKNPYFARYHRVRIHKCSFDRHSGRATHPGVIATIPDGPSIDYDLYSHGQKIVLATLSLLRGPQDAGLSYPSWRANGNSVQMFTESLPSIAGADQVMFIGHSAAAHGLYQNIDRYADFLRTFPGFDGDVRSVHDAHFMAAVENEAAFDPAQNPDPVSINTLFDQRLTGHTPVAGAYDSGPYHNGANAPFSEDYRAWLEHPDDDIGTLTDASCAASHAPSERWICKDRFHVRLHHQSTAALLREDITDPNFDHLNLPFGRIIWWGEIDDYAHCMAMTGQAFCPPVSSITQNTPRLLMQFSHFRSGVFTRSELATDRDTSTDSGSVAVWMPSCGDHGGAYDDTQFFRTSIVQDGQRLSYHDFMRQFAEAPPTGAFLSRVHGADDGVSECNPMFDGFE